MLLIVLWFPSSFSSKLKLFRIKWDAVWGTDWKQEKILNNKEDIKKTFKTENQYMDENKRGGEGFVGKSTLCGLGLFLIAWCKNLSSLLSEQGREGLGSKKFLWCGIASLSFFSFLKLKCFEQSCHGSADFYKDNAGRSDASGEYHPTSTLIHCRMFAIYCLIPWFKIFSRWPWWLKALPGKHNGNISSRMLNFLDRPTCSAISFKWSWREFSTYVVRHRPTLENYGNKHHPRLGFSPKTSEGSSNARFRFIDLMVY